MKIGKEVTYFKTKEGKLGPFPPDNFIVIETEDLKTHMYKREEYELFLNRIQKINKLLNKK